VTTAGELRFRRKDGHEEIVVLVRTPFALGRSGSDMNLDDTAVSRRHCELVEVGAGWVLRDLKSSNGTFLNGVRVTEQPLKDGDRVKIGQTEIVFRVRVAASGQAAGASPGAGGINLAEDTALWNIIELSVGAGESAHWLRAYLETLMKRFQSERGFIVEYERLTEAVKPLASVAMEFVEQGPDGERAFSRSIVDQAVASKHAVATTDAEVDPRFRDATSVAKYDINAVLCAPARWQGEPVAVVYLERVISKSPYTDEDAQQLQDLADLLGIALMAWRGHHMEHRETWEREQLARNFSEATVQKLVGRGGANAVKRQAREVCTLVMHLGRLSEMINSIDHEPWKLISQFYAQAHEIIFRHGGALIAGDCAQFGTFEDDEEFQGEAVRAGVEIQRIARPMVNRVMRELKLPISVGIGISTGQALTGYFGAGQRVDFHGFGEVYTVARGTAAQAEDGEVLVDQNTYNGVRLHFTINRIAPVSLTGVARQIQLYRVVPF